VGTIHKAIATNEGQERIWTTEEIGKEMKRRLKPVEDEISREIEQNPNGSERLRLLIDEYGRICEEVRTESNFYALIEMAHPVRPQE